MTKRGLIFRPKKSYRGILLALRRMNKSWDETDMTLILCCVRAFHTEQALELPREIASTIAHRLLAEHLCTRYGCTFVYPNTVVGQKERAVVLPLYKVVHAGDSRLRARSGFGTPIGSKETK